METTYSAERTIARLCLDMKAHSCSYRHLQEMDQAVRLLPRNKRSRTPLDEDKVWIFPQFRSSPGVLSLAGSPYILQELPFFPLSQNRFLLDFQFQSLNQDPRADWAARLFRQVLCGLGFRSSLTMVDGTVQITVHVCNRYVGMSLEELLDGRWCDRLLSSPATRRERMLGKGKNGGWIFQRQIRNRSHFLR